jgi:hypothetical protein
MQSREDKDNLSYEEIAPSKFARRVTLDDLNSAVPQNWKGVTLNYTDGNLSEVLFYSDELKTNLIKTITLSYTDGNLSGVVAV